MGSLKRPPAPDKQNDMIVSFKSDKKNPLSILQKTIELTTKTKLKHFDFILIKNIIRGEGEGCEKNLNMCYVITDERNVKDFLFFK